MKIRRSIAGLASLLIFVALACSTAGEVLSPEEATQRAQPTERTQSSGNVENTQAFQTNETVEFSSPEFLVLMRNSPGDLASFSTQATRGEKATVLDFEEVNGEEWYRVKGPAGEGWVPGEYLVAVGSADGEESETSGLQVGDTAYLAGLQFLIPILDSPEDQRMIAGQERGVAVEILEIFELDGVTWYRIDAPAGEGWVPAENLSAEAP